MDKIQLQELLKQIGHSDEDIEKAFATETGIIKSSELTKKLYIIIWNSGKPKNIMNALTPAIIAVTKSVYTHTSWSPYSTGTFYSLSGANGLLDFLFKENGSFVQEDLNAMKGISMLYDTRYNCYSIDVTETEFARATDIVKLHKNANFKYSFGKLFGMGIKFIFKKSPEELFSGFKDQTLYLQKLVCSTYVVLSICQSAPRFIQWFRENNFSTDAITPANVAKIPSAQFLFSGNLLFEFNRWKQLYEKKNGFLPN
jgi:hypothetical protein